MSMRFWIEIQKVLSSEEGISQTQHKRDEFWGRFFSVFKIFRKKNHI